MVPTLFMWHQKLYILNLCFKLHATTSAFSDIFQLQGPARALLADLAGEFMFLSRTFAGY